MADHNANRAELLEGMKQNKTPVFWVLGGPGSGKGTQCAMLVEKYKFVHLSSGDLLREEVSGESDIGKLIQGVMAKGELVPRHIVLELIKNAMVKRLPSAAGFLIDGYPREIPQAEEFEEQIAPSSLIIYFDCSDDTMLGRLLKRAQTSGRSDDNELTIKNRIDTFHQVSEPVMKKYAEKVATIPAETSTDQIFAACCVEVNKTLAAAGKEVPA